MLRKKLGYRNQERYWEYVQVLHGWAVGRKYFCNKITLEQTPVESNVGDHVFVMAVSRGMI